MLSVVSESTPNGCITSVIKRIGPRLDRLLLEQPPGLDADYHVFKQEQILQLIWTDAGMRFGARAEVVGISSRNRLPAYDVRIDSSVYRQQRREAFRVPVGPGDGLSARFWVDRGEDALIPSIKDLSAKGCRLSLPLGEALDMGVSSDFVASLTVEFRNDGKVHSSKLCVVWTARISDELMEVGTCWIEPSTPFVDSIERFVVGKERLLLQRRSGTNV